MGKRTIQHASGMVEFLPDPKAEARRILDEHGLDALLYLLARVRAIEQANGPTGADFSSNLEAVKHPLEAAFEQLTACQAALDARLQGGPPCSPKL